MHPLVSGTAQVNTLNMKTPLKNKTETLPLFFDQQSKIKSLFKKLLH